MDRQPNHTPCRGALNPRNQSTPVVVFDFFCGCGGASAGFKKAGMEIALGLDNDLDAGQTFKANFPEAEFIGDDITKVSDTNPVQ